MTYSVKFLVAKDRRESGFSITEVLIMLFVLSVGMAGASRLVIEAKIIQQTALWHEQATLIATRVIEMARALGGRASAAEFKAMAEAKMAEDKQSLVPIEILANTQCTVELLPEHTHVVQVVITKELPTRQSIKWTIEL